MLTRKECIEWFKRLRAERLARIRPGMFRVEYEDIQERVAHYDRLIAKLEDV